MPVVSRIAQRLVTEHPDTALELVKGHSNLITDEELVSLFGEPTWQEWCLKRIVDRLQQPELVVSSAIITLLRDGDLELHQKFFCKLGMPSSGKWREIRFAGWMPYPSEIECQEKDAKVDVAISRINPALRAQYFDYWEGSVKKGWDAQYERNAVLLGDFRSGDEVKALKAAEAIADDLIANPNQSFFGGIWEEIGEFLEARGRYDIVGEMAVSAHANK